MHAWRLQDSTVSNSAVSLFPHRSGRKNALARFGKHTAGIHATRVRRHLRELTWQSRDFVVSATLQQLVDSGPRSRSLNASVSGASFGLWNAFRERPSPNLDFAG